MIWGGVPYRLIHSASVGDISLFASTVLLEELYETLSRPHLASRIGQQQTSVERALDFYGQLVARVVPRPVPRVSRDPDDDHVIPCAVAAEAQLIISGDKDLLDLGSYRSIAILAPAEAIARIEARLR